LTVHDVAQSLVVELEDHTRQCYERLRNQYLYGLDEQSDSDTQRFARLGLAGLLEAQPPRGYVTQIHQAKGRSWCNGDSHDAVLGDVVRLVLGPKLGACFEQIPQR
jgi:hypothetical protein